jgi:N-dimethylarginine dimethylaminohydrolase
MNNTRFLMCPPQHFAVTYSINPWMKPDAWLDGAAPLHALATRQWQALHETLSRHASVELVTPAENLPDLVFTANAAVVLDRKALLARFRHAERQGEQPVFAAAFNALAARGLLADVVEMPQGVSLEGAGDCIYDAARGLFWMGSGFRSDPAAARVVEETFGLPCVPLALADPRYYHLDTALCALPCGAVMYFPGAFTREARAEIEARVAPAQRIALSEDDAAHFAANAVCVGRVIVLSRASDALKLALAARGYAVVERPLDAFLRSGGSACCLTLRLDHQSAAQATPKRAAHGG